MKLILLAGILFLFGVALAANLPPCRNGYCSLDSRLIALNTSEGYRLLSDGKMHDFFQLVNNFQTQSNLASCGIASAVTVLNSMHIEKPGTYCWNTGCLKTFTERYITRFHHCTKQITRKYLTDPGLDLNQVRDIFKCFGLRTELQYANETSEEVLLRSLRLSYRPGTFVIANYLREGVFQKDGGHFSPIGGFSDTYDRALIMDVTRFLYPPVWVRSDDLISAMNTTTKSRNSRGLLLIWGPSYPGRPYVLSSIYIFASATGRFAFASSISIMLLLHTSHFIVT